MIGRLDGKVVLLSGAGQGLGAATMRLFAREGAILYLASDESRCVTGAELVVDCGHLTM